MSVEFIGYVATNDASEIHPPTGFDREWVKKSPCRMKLVANRNVDRKAS